MLQLAETLRVLGDENRLRIMRLLLEESLNVGELTQVLGLAQPTVSKHLAELRKAGLVQGHRNGGYSYYQIAEKLGPWWQPISSSLSSREDEKGDLSRLREVLKQRQEVSEPAERFVVPGRSWVAWSRSLRFLLPPLRVADFGCGDGAFTVEMAAWAKTVYAVDCNPHFLKLARHKANGIDNIHFLRESMERVSIASSSIDLVVVSQSLHYLAKPRQAILEAFRILVPGGRLLLLDLLPHREQWVVSELHHLWLGLEPARVRRWLEAAGFEV
ncbi:MAG: ArsR/SmtB family transcription factor, partial [Acidobacteriota bacterium]